MVSSQDSGFAIGKVNILEKDKDIDASVAISDIVPCLSILNAKNVEIDVKDKNLLIIDRENSNCYSFNTTKHFSKIPSFTSTTLASGISGQDLTKLLYVCNKSNNIDNFNKVTFSSGGIFAYSYTMGMLIESQCTELDHDLYLGEDDMALAAKLLKAIKKDVDVCIAKETVCDKDDFLNSLINGTDPLGGDDSCGDSCDDLKYILFNNLNISLYLKADQSDIPNIGTIISNINKNIEFTLDKGSIDDIFKKYKDLKFGNANSVMHLDKVEEKKLYFTIESPDKAQTKDTVGITNNILENKDIDLALNARNLKSLLLKEDSGFNCYVDINNGMFVVESKNKKFIFTKNC